MDAPTTLMLLLTLAIPGLLMCAIAGAIAAILETAHARSLAGYVRRAFVLDAHGRLRLLGRLRQRRGASVVHRPRARHTLLRRLRP